MKSKKNYVECAPVDLASLTRYELAVFVCGLKRNALRVVLDKLEAIEADKRKEAKK